VVSGFIFFEETLHWLRVGKTSLTDPDLICVFVHLISQGEDEFYIFRLSDLQQIIFEHYNQNLARQKGVCPKNPNSTHTAINSVDLKMFKDNWS
jgi:hypothetical protein